MAAVLNNPYWAPQSGLDEILFPESVTDGIREEKE